MIIDKLIKEATTEIPHERCWDMMETIFDKYQFAHLVAEKVVSILAAQGQLKIGYTSALLVITKYLEKE